MAFTYASINSDYEIRVLQLEDDYDLESKEQLLRFNIDIVPLQALTEQARPYYAVSYAWGLDPPFTPILLDGKECLVRESAEMALRSLLKVLQKAELDPWTPIWIDAISINQNDLPEKSAQVAHMGDVYSNAACVLVWLGDDDTTTESAVRTLLDLSDQCLERTGGDEQLTKDDGLPHERKVSLSYWKEDLPSNCDWAAFESLLQCRWFTRLWCLQEVVLARRLAWFRGAHYFSWEALSLAARWTSHKNFGPRGLFRDRLQFLSRLEFVGNVNDLRTGEKKTVENFDELLWFSIHLEASNPRDRIYALLGLLPSAGDRDLYSHKIVPDYTRDVRHIYYEAATLAMEHSSQPLMLLETFQGALPIGNAHPDDWPSWLPNFHVFNDTTFYFAAPLSSGDDSVCDGLRATYELSPSDPDVLEAKGVQVGTIKFLRPPPFASYGLLRAVSEDVQRTMIYEHFVYLWKPCEASNGIKTWNIETLRSLAITLAGNPYNDGDPLTDEDVSTQIVRDFACFLLNLQSRAEEPLDESLAALLTECEIDQGDADCYLESMMDEGALYSLMLTDKGMLGLCGNSVREGDEICILFGANNSFIVRKQNERWKLRGTCRIPSIARGEYIQQLRRQDRLEAQTQTFSLH